MSLLANVDKVSSTDNDEEIGEFEIELLLCLVDHCGTQLRSDDPLGLKNVITCIKQRATSNVNKDSARVRFMLEAMIDLKNNKSKRLQSSNEEAVKKMRKWIGTMRIEERLTTERVPNQRQAQGEGNLEVMHTMLKL